jgi:hypothetical protein
MSRAEPATAISPRFAAASSALSRASAGLNAERAAEITSKCERISERAHSHFEKHRQLWTNRQYGELLSRDGQRMALRPHGMSDDRKAHLVRAADSMVLQRQARRLAKIERAASNMLGKGGRDNSQGAER